MTLFFNFNTGIKSPYDLGRVYVHIFTHPRDRQYKTMMKPRPFDTRGIQNFSSLDDVLTKVNRHV